MLNTKLHLNKELFLKDSAKKTNRAGFGDALVKLGEENPDIVVFTADLKESTKTDKFAEKYPERFIETGIAEQNMASIAAGMALSGKIPFVTSLAVFSPGRNWEQIRLSVCFSNANVKIIGSHSGLSNPYDGGMAQCLEDIALTRVLPRIVVLEPCDYHEAYKATIEAAKHKGPVYIRLSRPDTPVITTEKTPFEIGKAYQYNDGGDVSIIACGPVLYEALSAAKNLKSKYGISADVLNCPSIKPLDDDTIITSAKKTGLVVTVENHQTSGGLGGAVAEMLSEKHPTKMIRIGVRDKFGESGHYEELLAKYGLSAFYIEHKIIKALGKKTEDKEGEQE